MSLARLAVEISANTSRFTSEMREMRTQAQKNFDGIKSAAKSVGGVLAGAFAVGSIVNYVQEVTRASNEIERMSRVLGMSSGELQTFALAAQSVGFDLGKSNDVLKDWSDRVGDFATAGGGPLVDWFDTVGKKTNTTIEDFQRLSGPEGLALLVKRSEEAGLSQQELVFHMEAITGEGSALLPILQNNAEGLRTLGAEAQSVGAVMDKSTIAQTKQFQLAMQRLGNQVKGFTNQLTASLGPGLTAIAKALGTFIERSGILRFAAKAIEVAFQTVAVIGSDLYFVISQIALGVVAMGKAAYQAATGDFKAAGETLKAYGENAKKARIELDEFQATIMKGSGALPVVPDLPATTGTGTGTGGKGGKAGDTAGGKGGGLAGDVKAAAETTRVIRTYAEQIQEDVARMLEGAPEARAKRQEMMLAEVDKLYFEGGMSAKDYEFAVNNIMGGMKAVAGAGAQSVADYANATKMSVLTLQDATMSWSKSFEDSLVNAAMTGKLSFSDMARAILADLARIAIQKAIMNMIPGGNIFGSLLSFDGGGYTGNGARSGGIDGRGGFLSVLHPQESIIDHTKGQRMGGGTIVQNIYVSDAGNRTEGTGSESAKLLAQMIATQTKSILINEKRPGGLLST